jgi:hypothetical protein
VKREDGTLARTHSLNGRHVQRVATALALGVCAVGKVGCSSDKGAESQFRATDGSKSSLLFYVGVHIPLDETRVPQEARGQVLACWYRSDVQTNAIDKAIAAGSMSPEQAQQIFFAPGNVHQRVTRYPSKCEEVPTRASVALGVQTDYTPMCKPEFSKGDAMKGQEAKSLQLFEASDIVKLIGQNLIGNNQGASSQGNVPDGMLNLVVSQMTTPPEDPAKANPQKADAKADATSVIPQLLAKVVGMSATDAKKWEPLVKGVGALFSNDGTQTTSQRFRNLGTALGGALGAENGSVQIGPFRVNPEILGSALGFLFPESQNQPAATAQTTTTTTSTTPQVTAPTAPVATSPSPTATPASALDIAHPKVEMAQLNKITTTVASTVGVSPLVIVAGKTLSLAECPLKF